MKRKDLIKKLETKEKELKGLISMGDQLGEEMAIALCKHACAMVDLNGKLQDVQGKLKRLKEDR
jgi:hypothetical protein